MESFFSKILNLYHRMRERFGRRKLRKILTNAFTLVILLALCIYLYQNQGSLQRIKAFKAIDIAIIFSIQLLNLFVLGLFNMVMYKRIEPKVSFSDSILLQYLNNFFNNILPKGGGIYRAIYLKTQYSFPYTRFVSAITGLYVITFLTNSILGLISIMFISNKYGQNELVLMLLFLLVFLGSLFVVFLNPNVISSHNRLIRMLNSVIIGWKSIKEKPRDVIFLVLLSLLNIILKTVQLSYIYRTLGVGTSWVEMLYLATLAVIMQVVTITPSGIGIREAVFAFSSNVIFVSDDILVLGSLIIRAIAIPGSIIAGLFCYSILQKRLKEKAIKISNLRDQGNQLQKDSVDISN